MIPETQDLGIREVPDAEALAIEMGMRLEEVFTNVEALLEKVGSLWLCSSNVLQDGAQISAYIQIRKTEKLEAAQQSSYIFQPLMIGMSATTAAITNALAVAVTAMSAVTICRSATQTWNLAAQCVGTCFYKQEEAAFGRKLICKTVCCALQVMALEVKAASAKAAADNAEAVASAAMSAAESAVREEMEAAAVAKSTASALNSVVAELKDLGVSFETSDKLERTLQAKGVSRVRPSLLHPQVF